MVSDLDPDAKMIQSHSPKATIMRASLWGPVTRARLLRLGMIYAVVYICGLLLAHGFGPTPWRAFGLGLIVPGGGFLVHFHGTATNIAVHGALAAASLVMFLAALGGWFATGNVLAPIVVWMGSAIAAGHMDHGGSWMPSLWIVPSAMAVAVVGISVGIAAYRQIALRQRDKDNQYVSQVPIEDAAARRAAGPGVDYEEFSLEDLQLMRFLLDRALQPVDAFEGFEWIDQFQTAAVRYQLNFAGYALAMAQYTRLTALGGYFTEAQRNLIEKQRDHRIWGYWALENLWGNLASDPNPVSRDNIMYSGFCAAQIALYQGATGDRCYNESGSFSLSHPSGATYDYELEGLTAELVKGYGSSAFGLMACEPNWIFPLCNAIGATALVSRDAQEGTKRWDRVSDDYRRHLDAEFTTLSGRLISCRSSYTGLGAPRFGGAVVEATPSLFLNTHAPDLAKRNWILSRRGMTVEHNDCGRSRLLKRGFWPVDVGNYRLSRASSYAGVAAVAAEMGDTALVAQLLSALDDDCPAVVDDGVAHRSKASVWAHGAEVLARSGGVDALRSLALNPIRSRNGPLIDRIAYPDVLVAKAINQNGALYAVLYPGRTAGRQSIGLSGLRPDSEYSCVGGLQPIVRSDGKGAADLAIELPRRTELRITPVA